MRHQQHAYWPKGLGMELAMKKTVVLNLKMNPETLEQVRKLTHEITSVVLGTGVDLVVCPPFPYLPSIGLPVRGIQLGAQDCHWEVKGAFTGEVSPTMLSNIGVTHVILGHSERRARGETDEVIGKKVAAAVAAGLIPILCVGETQEEREAGLTDSVIARQFRAATAMLPAGSKLAAAYEPQWAIGSGLTPALSDIHQVGIVLRVGFNLSGFEGPIHYGGSVKPSNIKEILGLSTIGGVLVGGASLDPVQVDAICQAAVAASSRS